MPGATRRGSARQDKGLRGLATAHLNLKERLISMDKNSMYVAGMVFFSGLSIFCAINNLTLFGIASAFLVFLLLVAYK
jgi:hypothetical protein